MAVPLKHLGGWDVGVRIVGPVHGFAFVAYLWNVWQTGTVAHWRNADLASLIVSAFVPLGGFLNWAWLVRQSDLAETIRANHPPHAGYFSCLKCEELTFVNYRQQTETAGSE